MDNEEIPRHRKKKQKTKYAIEEKYYNPDLVGKENDYHNSWLRKNRDWFRTSSYVKLEDAEKALKSIEKKLKLPLWSKVYRHYSYRIVEK